MTPFMIVKPLPPQDRERVLFRGQSGTKTHQVVWGVATWWSVTLDCGGAPVDATDRDLTLLVEPEPIPPCPLRLVQTVPVERRGADTLRGFLRSRGDALRARVVEFAR